jgi:hypothetical protein
MGLHVEGVEDASKANVRDQQYVGFHFNLVSQAKLWIETFPQYAYPVIIILGLIILSMLYSCVKGCCCGKKNNQRALTRPAYPHSAPAQPAYRTAGVPGNRNRASDNSTTSQAELNRLNHGIYPEVRRSPSPKIVKY